MVKYFGLGNFLGGMAQGYQQMAKLQQDQERLMLEAEVLKAQKDRLTQDAQQFTEYQALQREMMAQELGIATEDAALARERMNMETKQFTENQALQRERLAQEARLATQSDALIRKRMAQESGLARDRLSAEYGMHMEDVRFREREALRADRISPKEAVLLSTMLTDVVPRLSAEQGDMLRGIFEPMLRRAQPPQDTLGGTVTEGLSGFQQFYRGGILTGLGQ